MNLQGYAFDPNRGIVIGKRGKSVGRVCARGYIEIHDRNNTFRAHRMIWQYVHGPIPEGMEINHKNGIKTDNRIENLELVTRSENALHASKLGLTNYSCERNGRAKLSNEEAIVIRASKEKSTDLAAAFGVTVQTIQRIRSGRGWRNNLCGEQK